MSSKMSCFIKASLLSLILVSNVNALTFLMDDLEFACNSSSSDCVGNVTVSAMFEFAAAGVGQGLGDITAYSMSFTSSDNGTITFTDQTNQTQAVLFGVVVIPLATSGFSGSPTIDVTGSDVVFNFSPPSTPNSTTTFLFRGYDGTGTVPNTQMSLIYTTNSASEVDFDGSAFTAVPIPNTFNIEYDTGFLEGISNSFQWQGSFTNQSIASPVPLPAGLWLFSSALLGLFRLKKSN